MKIFKLLIILLIFSGCKKEEDVFLLINTLEPTFHGDSISLNGQFVSFGQSKVLEYGFVMGKRDLPDLNKGDSVVPCFAKAKIGKYAVSILNDIDSGLVYNVRSFAKTSEETVYGNQVELTGRGRIAAKILDFMPKHGKDGDFIKIHGLYFGINDSWIKVFLGAKEAEIVEQTTGSLIIKVPPYKFREDCFITIEQNGQTTTSADRFKLDGPEIINFSPSSGNGDITLVITGKNFSDQPWRNVVTVGTEKANVIESSGTQIKAELNTLTILPGKYNLIVGANEKWDVSTDYFEVLSPWKEIAPIPYSGLAGTTAIEINNKIYLCTGTDDLISNGGYSTVVFEFDIQSGTWTRKKDFPGERRVSAAGFSIGNKIYFGTGYGYSAHSALSDFWEYDPASDHWTRKNDVPGGPRSKPVAFAYQSKGYLLMGSAKVDFYRYDPGNDSWEQLADFPGHKRNGAYFTIINDKLYIIGGQDAYNPYEPDIWQYDFLTEKWTFIGYKKVYPIAVFSNNEKCYILERKLNYISYENQIILHEFDPLLNKIIRKMEIFPGPDRFSNSFAIVVNNDLYFGGGGVEECLNDMWKYPLDGNN
ncbi:MAG: hypothetical protein GXO86_00765 [Chlorobi bacterium]|nr:hypothetical protein [Chlorobiota bacterium]